MLKLPQSKHHCFSCTSLSSSLAESNLQILSQSTLQITSTIHNAHTVTDMPSPTIPTSLQKHAYMQLSTDADWQTTVAAALSDISGGQIN